MKNNHKQYPLKTKIKLDEIGIWSEIKIAILREYACAFGLHLPGDLYDAVLDLNRVSVPTRYPDDLRRLTQTYRKGNTRSIVEKSKEVLKWLRARP